MLTAPWQRTSTPSMKTSQQKERPIVVLEALMEDHMKMLIMVRQISKLEARLEDNKAEVKVDREDKADEVRVDRVELEVRPEAGEVLEEADQGVREEDHSQDTWPLAPDPLITEETTMTPPWVWTLDTEPRGERETSLPSVSTAGRPGTLSTRRSWT